MYMSAEPFSVKLARMLAEKAQLPFEDWSNKEVIEISRAISQQNKGESILIVDLNADPYYLLNSYPEIVRKVKFYITSSSVQESDMEKAENDPRVNGYLTQPLALMDLVGLV